MFKKGDTVVYPLYGTSKITKIYKEEDNGEKYYELEFKENLTISVPVEKAEQYGMRYPMSKDELKKVLKKAKPARIDFLTLTEFTKEKFATGRTHDIMELIATLQAMDKTKKETNQKTSLTERDNLIKAIDFLKSEVELVLGKKAAEEII